MPFRDIDVSWRSARSAFSFSADSRARLHTNTPPNCRPHLERRRDLRTRLDSGAVGSLVAHVT